MERPLLVVEPLLFIGVRLVMTNHVELIYKWSWPLRLELGFKPIPLLRSIHFLSDQLQVLILRIIRTFSKHILILSNCTSIRTQPNHFTIWSFKNPTSIRTWSSYIMGWWSFGLGNHYWANNHSPTRTIHLWPRLSILGPNTSILIKNIRQLIQFDYRNKRCYSYHLFVPSL